jgi:DUF1009 family protein
MIGLIAGQGQLPVAVHHALKTAGRAHVIAAMGDVDPSLPDVQPFQVEQLGTFFAALMDLGVSQVCFAGAVARPQIDSSKIDAATLPLVPKIAAAMAGGDDSTLRVAISLFEDAGFEVVAAPQIVDGLLPPHGDLTSSKPSERDLIDISRAQDVHGALAAADVGQAVIVAQGQVLAVEALLGTDWMVQSLLQAAPAQDVTDVFSDPLGFATDVLAGPIQETPRRHSRLPKGGVLYKAPKAGQDLRIDLPTIGPKTVLGAIALGLNGIAIGPSTQVLELDKTIAAASDGGLFLYVLA